MANSKRGRLQEPCEEVTVEVKGRDNSKIKKRRKVEIWSSYLSRQRRQELKDHLEDFVQVKRSSVKGAGVGVFAKKDLPKGFQVPYLGKLYRGEFELIVKLLDGNALYIMHDDENSIVIDGHPRYNSLACNVGFRINEPPPGTKPSMEFVSTTGWAKAFTTISAKTTRKVRKGEELFVDYGDSYDRSHYSK
jgi:hypothetical protein